MASYIKEDITTALPLDQQFVTMETMRGGRVERTEALNPRWKVDVNFRQYKSPPDDAADTASLEEWIDILTNMEEDLHWLLQQSHQKFWCQVLFDDSLHRCLESYLRYAPRMFDHVTRLPQSAMERQRAVHRLVFMTFLRMSTHKESQEHHITPSAFGDMIYENFLFDIPKLFDLCVLYGGNNTLLNKMLTNIFTQQPKYEDDLSDIIPTFLQVFYDIKTKCGLSDFSTEPQKITSTPKQTVSSLSTKDFRDVIFYLCDIGLTLLAFLEIYPPACRVLHQHTLVSRISNFYEVTIPEIEKSLKQRKADHPSLYTMLKTKLSQAKKAMVKICHLILFTCCLQPMLDNSGEQEVIGVCVEDYLQMMSSILSDKHFLCHYNTVHSVQEDVDMILQLTNNVDETRTQFILDAVGSAMAMYRKAKTAKHKEPVSQNAGSPRNETNKQSVLLPEDFESEIPDLSEYGAGACAASVSGVELESLISSVKDLLPDLGEGFIIACLEEFNYGTEKLINSLLEDNLPASLRKLDRNMSRETYEIPEEVNQPLVSQRQNIYDNDEFDVFKRDTIDTSKIHKGKKSKDYKSVLDDKSDVQAMKPRFEEYDVIYDTIYDDEYDDTYDDNDIGANDEDSADELTARRPFTTPRILGGSKPNKSSDEEERYEPVPTTAPPRDQFVPNPAELREKQQERMRSKFRGQPHKQALVGQAKGKGQTAQTEQKRRQKEKNKSSRANHNRRAMSDKKMSKGMF